MKKVMLFLWMLSLLWAPGVYAAEIPAQQGLVMDKAGLLTSGDTSTLTTTAAGNRYTFHILTIESLGGAASTSYATAVYNSWGLSSRDILLLISNEDQQVEFQFNNPSLQSFINSWSQEHGGGVGRSAITTLLDTYFIPYAKDGDFAGGILSLMEATQSLSASGTSSAVQSTFPVAATLLILIGAVLILGIAYVVIAGIRRRTALHKQKEQLGDLLVQANRAIESLKPFQGIVQGKTAEKVEAISERLSTNLIEISVLRNEGGEAAPALYHLKALKQAEKKLREINTAFRAALLEEEKQIAIISEADRNVKQRITELEKEAPELGQQLSGAVLETGYQLQEIAMDIKELVEETAKANQLELFDPLAAQEITEDAQDKQEQIEKDLQDVGIYDDIVDGFPRALADIRTQIAGIIEQNSLHNMKVQPFDNLDKASIEAANLEAPLRTGDMDEVRKIGGRLDLLLKEAVAMTERQALIRQNNQRDLETVRSHESLLNQQREALKGRISESRIHFMEKHVLAAVDNLETWSSRIRQSAAEVPQIESWSSDERGEYDTAHTALDRLLALQEEAIQQFNAISGSLDSLNERLDKVHQLFTEGQSRADAAEQLLHSRGLSLKSDFNLATLPEYDELQRKLSAAPYNLDELEALAHSYLMQIDSFVDEANRWVRQKEEAERQEQLARMREQQRREQSRKRMSSGPPSSGGLGGGRSSGGSSWGGGGKSKGNSSGGSKW